MVTLLAQATLAPPTSTGEINVSFIGWLIVTAILVINMLVGLKNLKRAPSVDVDVANLKSTIATLDNTLKSTNTNLKLHESGLAELREKISTRLPVLDEVARRLGDIEDNLRARDEVMSTLREKQSGNSTSISSIKTDVHEIRTMIMGIVSRTKAH